MMLCECIHAGGWAIGECMPSRRCHTAAAAAAAAATTAAAAASLEHAVAAQCSTHTALAYVRYNCTGRANAAAATANCEHR